MIKSSLFWDKESKAPLLKRNANFFTQELDKMSQHVENSKYWLDIALNPIEEITSINSDYIDSISQNVEDQILLDQNIKIELVSKTDNPGIDRIFKLDAERTFSDERNREEMIKILSTIYQEIKDYHQGLGFVVAFLMLQFSPEDTVRLALSLNRYYLPGYFKTAPYNYVRDAKVFEKLLLKRYPDVAKKVHESACAEAFCSKWFVGLNVHVLPFPALYRFFEILFSKGNIFLFQFGLSIIEVCRDDILNAKDTSQVLAILRLDEKIYCDSMEYDAVQDQEGSGNFFIYLVENALNISVAEEEIKEMREIVLDEMRIQEERRKKLEAELDLDDDEIVFSDEE